MPKILPFLDECDFDTFHVLPPHLINKTSFLCRKHKCASYFGQLIITQSIACKSTLKHSILELTWYSIFAANRDEFLKRPTARAHFWEEPHDNVLAGIDLEAKLLGTWLGITKQGQFAALTNFREPNFKGKVSRGVLIRDFLCGNQPVHSAIQSVVDHGADFGGFNLVCFDFGKSPTDMAYCTNREKQPVIDLEPGVIYGNVCVCKMVHVPDCQ